MHSNIPNLIEKVDKLLEAVIVARGTASDLIKAAPLEIRFYNTTTSLKSTLEGFKAELEDAAAIYMEREKK